MSDSYVGEVRLVGFNYAPLDWAFCNGALLPISQFNVLFNLIGTTYGGDGQTNFQLPNLQGRIPIHQGSNGVTTYTIGEVGGAEKVTIAQATYPTHTHFLMASANAANSSTAGNSTVAQGPTAYTTQAPPTTPMNALMVGSSGGSQPHDNMQPYQVLNWVISLFGIYPPQS